VLGSIAAGDPSERYAAVSVKDHRGPSQLRDAEYPLATRATKQHPVATLHLPPLLYRFNLRRPAIEKQRSLPFFDRAPIGTTEPPALIARDVRHLSGKPQTTPSFPKHPCYRRPQRIPSPIH
jgi:hypothetical protein